MMINADFGKSFFRGISAGRSESIGHISSPMDSKFAKAMSMEGSIFSLAKDKKEYQMPENNQVAYANPFSFVFNGTNDSNNSTVSAFLG